MKDDLSRYLRLAGSQEIVITRHGRPAGVLIGFDSEEDWFEYQLEQNPEFLHRIAAAREAIRHGKGVVLEEGRSSRGRLTNSRASTAVSRGGSALGERRLRKA